jgi:nucleoside-diphosphate-sugar epimerase
VTGHFTHCFPLYTAGKHARAFVISRFASFGSAISLVLVGEPTINVFVAGATGAIGHPLLAELLRQGHTVTGMTRSVVAARTLVDMGAAVALVSAFDPPGVEAALRQSGADVVIDQLTALPDGPLQFAAALPGDRRVRLEGGGNLHRAAQAVGVQRYLQQSSGFYLRPGAGLGDESERLATAASASVAASARVYEEIELRLQNSGSMETIGLRYGFFYGPRTWYRPDGAVADLVRQQQMPIIGEGAGVWSFVHIEDAARATVAALTIPPGIYHIVDDDPLPVSRWLPEFARWVGAPPPLTVTEQVARETLDEDTVYLGTKLRGASNQLAKRTFNFQPRPLEWLSNYASR